VGRRHQAVPGGGGSGAAARLQPHAQAGLRRGGEQQLQRGKRLHRAGGLPHPGAGHRPPAVGGRHREHRGGGPEGHAGAGARHRGGGHRHRDPPGRARARPRRRPGAGHRADAQGRESGPGHRGGEGPRGRGAEAPARGGRAAAVLQPRPARADHRAHRAAQPDRGRRPGGHPAHPLPLRHPRRPHRGPHHSPLAAVRVHLHGPPRDPSQPALPGGDRLRDHRGRRGDHDREHRAPAGRAPRWRWPGRSPSRC